jgi:AP2 domain
VKLVCEFCSITFTRKPSRVVSAHCGKTCRARARRTESEPPPVEGARWIALNRGFALVDADRFEELNAFVWSVSGRDGKHVARGDGYKTLWLHHVVLDIPSHVHIDHKNRNGFDCRKSNLRVADNSLNHANTDKMKKATSSKFKGVHWRKGRGKWSAEIKVRYRKIKLGCYVDEREAALAYDRAALQHFGEFAKTNFLVEAHPS